jgi:hypothetical protein
MEKRRRRRVAVGRHSVVGMGDVELFFKVEKYSRSGRDAKKQN